MTRLEKSFWLLIPLGLIALYFATLNQGFFPIDDEALVKLPYFDIFDFTALRNIFTFGAHVDYFPIRDVSYLFDWIWGVDLSVDGTPARLQNLFWFFLSGYFLYQILAELGLERRTALLTSALWLFLPFHFELVVWLSARKDLIALAGALGSGLFYFKSFDSKHRETGFAVLAFLAGLISVMSKASYLLLPAAAGAWILIWNRKLLTQKKIASLSLMSLALFNFVFAWFQKKIYGEINDMFFNYTLDYRIKASLSSLGRVATGLLDPRVNTLDATNWGQWLEFNQPFFHLGLGLICGFLLFLAWAFLRKQKFQILMGLLFVATLAMIPGFNPFHRNFYSTRYFEGILLLVFIIFILTWRPSKKILLALTLFAFGASALESSHWESPLEISRKNYLFDPRNAAAAQLYWIELANLNRQGRLLDSEREEFKKIWPELLQSCRPDRSLDFRNGHLCLNFWNDYDSYERAARSAGLTEKLDRAEVQKTLEQGFRTILRENAKVTLTQTFDSQSLLEKFQPRDFYSKEKRRIQALFYHCYKGDVEKAREEYTYVRGRRLVSKLGFQDAYSLLNEKDREQIQGCLLSGAQN